MSSPSPDCVVGQTKPGGRRALKWDRVYLSRGFLPLLSGKSFVPPSDWLSPYFCIRTENLTTDSSDILYAISEPRLFTQLPKLVDTRRHPGEHPLSSSKHWHAYSHLSTRWGCFTLLTLQPTGRARTRLCHFFFSSKLSLTFRKNTPFVLLSSNLLL